MQLVLAIGKQGTFQADRFESRMKLKGQPYKFWPKGSEALDTKEFGGFVQEHKAQKAVIIGSLKDNRLKFVPEVSLKEIGPHYQTVRDLYNQGIDDISFFDSGCELNLKFDFLLDDFVG